MEDSIESQLKEDIIRKLRYMQALRKKIRNKLKAKN